MNDDVKQPRTYDTRNRQAAAQETRAAIMRAVRSCFLEKGYAGTSMAAIARTAGVHVDTIYASVGRKPELMRLTLETAISGEDAEVPAIQRTYVMEMQNELDAHRKLAIYARATREIQQRLAPLVQLVHEAAAAEPEIGKLWNDISERRARNMRLLVKDLITSAPLRGGLSLDEAADIIWATNGPDLYLNLVGQRHWTLDRYEAFLYDLWTRLLLDDD